MATSTACMRRLPAVGPAHVIMRSHGSNALLKLSRTQLPAVCHEVGTRVRAKLLALLASVVVVQRNNVGWVVVHWSELKVFRLHESEASPVKTKHYATRIRLKGYVIPGIVGAYMCKPAGLG